MAYKLLILEAIAVCGMLYLRFEPKITFGPAEPAPAARVEAPADEPVAVGDRQVGAPVAPLPRRKAEKVSSGLVFPVADHGPDNVISVFGDKRGKTRLHKGIDIKAPRGTAVVAVTDGFVERIRQGGSGGKQVYLRDGTGRLFYYAHLDSWAVEEYDAVRAGDVLGTVGDTGNAKGTTPHLHFEILLGKDREAIDPLGYWVGA